MSNWIRWLWLVRGRGSCQCTQPLPPQFSLCLKGVSVSDLLPPHTGGQSPAFISPAAALAALFLPLPSSSSSAWDRVRRGDLAALMDVCKEGNWCFHGRSSGLRAEPAIPASQRERERERGDPLFTSCVAPPRSLAAEAVGLKLRIYWKFFLFIFVFCWKFVWNSPLSSAGIKLGLGGPPRVWIDPSGPFDAFLWTFSSMTRLIWVLLSGVSLWNFRTLPAPSAGRSHPSPPPQITVAPAPLTGPAWAPASAPPEGPAPTPHTREPPLLSTTTSWRDDSNSCKVRRSSRASVQSQIFTIHESASALKSKRPSRTPLHLHTHTLTKLLLPCNRSALGGGSDTG